MIAPSVLSFDVNRLAEAIPVMAKAGASCIHFDVMDGQFVPPITFGAHFVASMRPLTDIPFEVHLMTETPEAQFAAFAEAGAQRIQFHLEATSHAHRLVQQLKGMGVEAGIVINPATPVETIWPLLHDVDEVLVMTVNPGWGGQKFIHSALDKVLAIRNARPDLLIQVDGGVDPTTLPIAKQAGANLFVVGSYLANSSDLASATSSLVQLCG